MSSLKEKEKDDVENNNMELHQPSTSKTSPKKVKRKSPLVASISNKKSKTYKSNEDPSVNSSSDGEEKDCLSEWKERRRNRRSDSEFSEITLQQMDLDMEIHKVIEQNDLKLTAKNVKNILRHVITNEHVLTMVRNTMKSNDDDEELEEAVYEPKLTRAKVKELREKQHELPWLVCSPLKQQEDIASRKLLEEEFSDESLSDEDYEPKKDEEEEENYSEEDDCPSSQITEIEECEEPVSSPVPLVSDEAIEDSNHLVIVLPKTDDASISESTEADKIALRTRSKLPLNDTPLETIEASFIAPDISVDMYDTECDNEDWQTFLRELTKPLDSKVVVEQPDDDIENDPEYNILLDDDIPDSWDLRNDKAVKISRKELNALMAELLESTKPEEDEEDNSTSKNEYSESTEISMENPCNARIYTPISIIPIVQHVFHLKLFQESSVKIQLEEQMRMHVQLLTQSYVLSHGVEEVSFIHESSKTLLHEIKMFATRERVSDKESAFNAYNLEGALDIIKDFESAEAPAIVRMKKYKGIPCINSLHVRQLLLNNKTFIYPELLPICSFRDDASCKHKTVFTASEDNLIAIGLEEFSYCKDPVRHIQDLLLPAKTEQQIKIRIKNSRCNKASSNNPINYYYKNNQAPEFKTDIKKFKPEEVIAPKDHPSVLLPQWMWPYSKVQNVEVKPLRPLAAKPVSPSKVAYQEMQKTPDKRKLNPIAARGMNHLSPLKKISPILRKYNQQRRVGPAMPWQLPVNRPKSRRKSSFNRQNYKPPLIQPKPSILNKYVGVSTERYINLSNPNISPVLNPAVPAQVVYAAPTIPPLAESSTHLKNNVGESNKRTTTKRSAQGSKENCATKRGTTDQKVAASESTRTRRGQEKAAQKAKANEIKASEVRLAEEVEEEAVDDEQDLAALMAASSTICKKNQSTNKKKNKVQRDLESSLALLKPNLVQSDPKKEEKEQLFASSYILRVAEALNGNPEAYDKFLKTLCKYQHSTRSPVKLYFELRDILKEHPALMDEFVAFLRPDQAVECGKFKEYTMFYKIREFLRKLEIHFSHQPQHLVRILRTFGQLRSQTGITSKDVLSTFQPLLRNHNYLLEELSQLLPDAAPPEHLMAEDDFENIAIPNSDDDASSNDSCEEIVIPDTIDPYGGKDCPCKCHTTPGETKHNKSKHCMKCGLKFVDGRIYVQSGKILKPVQVTYHGTLQDVVETQKDNSVFKKPENFKKPEALSLNLKVSANNNHSLNKESWNQPSTSKFVNS